MRARFNKLVVVRDAASRLATRDFAHAMAQLGEHEALAVRLDAAALALLPQKGPVSGAGLAAQLELSDRMLAARRMTHGRIIEALAERDDAGVARKAAQRALDAALDIRRTHRHARSVRAAAKAMPTIPKDQGR